MNKLLSIIFLIAWAVFMAQPFVNPTFPPAMIGIALGSGLICLVAAAIKWFE